MFKWIAGGVSLAILLVIAHIDNDDCGRDMACRASLEAPL